jgi:hypothetical protein
LNYTVLHFALHYIAHPFFQLRRPHHADSGGLGGRGHDRDRLQWIDIQNILPDRVSKYILAEYAISNIAISY